jgi:hypothetical protein
MVCPNTAFSTHFRKDTLMNISINLENARLAADVVAFLNRKGITAKVTKSVWTPERKAAFSARMKEVWEKRRHEAVKIRIALKNVQSVRYTV